MTEIILVEPKYAPFSSIYFIVLGLVPQTNNYFSLINNLTSRDFIKIETDKSNIEIVDYLSKKKVKVVTHIVVNPQKFSNFNKILKLSVLALKFEPIEFEQTWMIFESVK